MQHPSSTLYKNGRCLADIITTCGRIESTDEWAVFETVQKWRRLAKPLRLNAKTVTRYQVREAASYVNLVTGEVIPAADAAKAGLSVAGHVSEKMLRRESVLGGLRPEARAFAAFCLKFRNKRRGVTPGFDKLCHWYAALYGKRADNVRRLLPGLRQAGVMAGESLVGVEWQISGSKKSAADHLSEDADAEHQFGLMLANKGAGITFECKNLMATLTGKLAAPAWAEVMEAEYEMYLASGGEPDRADPEPITAANITPAQEAALLRAMAFLTAHSHAYINKDDEQ
ncbi:hypothetical protein [Paraburkholderia hospita]|uniref:hypothetical protein n=1 Tax=Paraburkholderia hospita TaxID=169430 RepID=UPI003ED017C7